MIEFLETFFRVGLCLIVVLVLVVAASDRGIR